MGIEWAAILIPAVAGLLLHYKDKHKVVWWEVLLPLLPVLIIVPLVKFSAETYLTADDERHGGWAVEARYYERWNEYIHKTCSYTTGSGKNTRVVTYDCSYVQEHPPIWEVEDSNGYVVPITSAEFEALAKKFKERTFKDMHRWHYTVDGDLYFARWGGKDENIQPVATHHYYENRVQATHGVIDYPEITDAEAAEKGLYPFPPLVNSLNDPAVLGAGPGAVEADHYLQIQNAKLGRIKEVRFWLLVFRDKPRQTGFDQESYWKGGNKNEVVVTVGLDKDNRVMWCHPFCWSPDGNTSNDEMRINIRDRLERQKDINLLDAAQFIVKEAKAKFKRKNFDEFSYLHVDMPGWALWLIYSLTVLTTAGVCWFVHENDVRDWNHR